MEIADVAGLRGLGDLEARGEPALELVVRRVRHHRDGAARTERVAQAQDDRDIDVAARVGKVELQLRDVEQVTALAAADQITADPVVLEVDLVQDRELAAIGMKYVTQGASRV